LGLTGFCKKSKDNNDLALVAGLVVAEQQAQQAAQAAYEEANKKENPEFFCAFVTKSSNVTYYTATLLPLVRQDCNLDNFFPIIFPFQRALDTIDSENWGSICNNTKNAISNIINNPPPGGGSNIDPSQIEFIYEDGKSLLSEVNLSTKTYTVVSPNVFKLFATLSLIKSFASGPTPETSCQNAVDNKLNSIDYGKFCSNTASIFFNLPTCDSNKTKVVEAKCAYGSGVPSNYRTCANLKDQF
jgi:hypothetical protein